MPSSIPHPRTPHCTRHHVVHVACADCMAWWHAEQQAAKERLEKAGR